MVRLGVFVSNEGDHASRLGLVTMARAAEGAGADGLWVSDHLLLFDEATTDYPFSSDGVPGWDLTADYYEALACCATMAAATESCRIGTAILVLPQRHPLEVAKTAATIDRLSDGRLALGLGAGWYRQEIEGLGHDFAARGRRFDEAIEVLRRSWTGRPEPYAGEYVSIPENLVMEPRPVKRDGIPLLIGGMSKPARRRAAKLGDGWLAIGTAEVWDGALLERQLEEVRELRGPDDSFELLLQLNCDPRDTERIAQLTQEAGRIGFGEVIIEPPWADGIEAAAATISDVRSLMRQ